MQQENSKYRYQLEHYSGKCSKHECPQCHHKTFVRYIDMETGEYLSDDTGRCDREVNCGYHKTPHEHFEETNTQPEKSYWFPKKELRKPLRPSGFSTISMELVNESLCRCGCNNFMIWFRERFGMSNAVNQALRYKIGSSSHWPCSTIFWQIDKEQRVRTGKIMLYDYHTGRRVKEPTSKIAWVHTQPPFHEFQLRQCFFGEHLLATEDKPVAIVESEKTAIIASIYFPDVLFLATGGLQNLNEDRCRAIEGRTIYLFPDLGAEDKWREKAAAIPQLRNAKQSTWLQKHSSEMDRDKGLDIGDFLAELLPDHSLNVEDYL